ncbi:MAG: hypothetical protein HY434_02540 [Candidatus Liptonbacteria bacterium]|nr:hypothetical protein [Candidatus Liptonbacteria bacterium]
MKGELKSERSSGAESPFELVESTLASHIVDTAPAQTGRAELVKQMSGATKVITAEKNPVAYLDRIMREARQAARRFRV